MKKIVLVMMIVVLVVSLTSCFPGDKVEGDKPAGFFSGILHGWIAPISLVVSLFKGNVKMFEVINSGFWYEFGFYIAIIGGFGGISLSRKKRKDD